MDKCKDNVPFFSISCSITNTVYFWNFKFTLAFALRGLLESFNILKFFQKLLKLQKPSRILLPLEGEKISILNYVKVFI